MRLTDPDNEARTVAERWKNQYYNSSIGEWRNIWKDSSSRIYQELVNLGDNPDPEDVEELIGNDSWTKTCCDECRVEHIPVAILSGDEEDIRICHTCAGKISYELWSSYYE